MDLNPLFALAPLVTLGLTAVALLLPAALQRPKVATGLAAGGFALTLVLLLPAWRVVPQTTALLRLDRYALTVTALLAGSGLGMCYYLRAIRELGRMPEGEVTPKPLGLSLAVLVVLAILLVGTGLYPQGLMVKVAGLL